MKIYIDEELPESCASCQFLVHCDECEGYENYCPFIGFVGYDISDNLKDGVPVTPSWERHEECPLETRPHGEWGKRTYGYLATHDCSNCGFNGNQLWHFCPNCGADMREEGQRFADGFCEGLQSMREGGEE